MGRREKEYEIVLNIMKELTVGNINKAESLSQKMRPSAYWKQLFSYLNANNYQMIQTVREADDEIMEYIAEHGCFGVLAHDSDFIIAEGIENYMSIEHLDLNTMRTKVYQRNGLASELGLDPSQLPLLATLNGNDIVMPEMVRGFHLSLLQDLYNFQELMTRPFLPRYHLLPRIAKWINLRMKLGLKPEQLAREAALATGCQELVELFTKSVTSYLLPSTPPKPSGDRDTSIGGGRLWNAVVLAAGQMMRNEYMDSQIHSIITRAVIFERVVIQFYNNDAYPTAEIVVGPMRKRLYGILLREQPEAERPILVEEVAFDGPGCQWPKSVSPIFPAEHPGLLTLWKNPSCPVESKWRLLCWAVNEGLSVEAVRSLPEPVNVPALALYYLVHGEYEFLKQWEASALVAMAVSLMSATAAELGAIVCHAVDAVAVHISNVYKAVCMQVCIVAEACGSPTTLHNYPEYAFFDGKLFHRIYRAMKNGAAGSKLCGSRPQDIATYRSIVGFLFPHEKE